MSVLLRCVCVVGLLLLGCGRTMESQAATEVLSKVTFKAEGGMVHKQDKILSLSQSHGWAWAILPDEIDLNRYPRLTMSLKTNRECVVYLELKDKKGKDETPLVGKDSRNNVWKMKLDLPNTAGEFKDVAFDLTEHFRPALKDRLLKVIVFSDPRCDVEIRSITFGK